MIPITVYSEGGGVGKTTITGNLAHACELEGADTLAIDFDQQVGSLSRLLGVDDNRDDEDQDDLVRHIVESPAGDFDDLIVETDAGFDVIPSHNRLETFKDSMDNYQKYKEEFDDEFRREAQLHRVLAENNVADDYDVIIIDPNAKADDVFKNAIHATRNLVMPVEPSGKGASSVQGLREIVASLEQELNIETNVMAAIPNNIDSRSNNDQFYVEQLESSQYDVPIKIGPRGALFKGCWRHQMTAFQYVEEVRDRKRDREMETLEDFRKLARYLLGDLLDQDSATDAKAEVA